MALALTSPFVLQTIFGFGGLLTAYSSSSTVHSNGIIGIYPPSSISASIVPIFNYSIGLSPQQWIQNPETTLSAEGKAWNLATTGQWALGKLVMLSSHPLTGSECHAVTGDHLQNLIEPPHYNLLVMIQKLFSPSHKNHRYGTRIESCKNNPVGIGGKGMRGQSLPIKINQVSINIIIIILIEIIVIALTFCVNWFELRKLCEFYWVVWFALSCSDTLIANLITTTPIKAERECLQHDITKYN